MRRPLAFFFSRVFLCIGTTFLLGVSSSQAQGYPHHQGLLGAEALPGQLIVKYKDNTFSPTPLSALGAVSTQQLVPTSKWVLKVAVDYVLPQERIALVTFDSWLSLNEMKVDLEHLPQVDYVEPNYLRYLSSLDSNDTYVGELRWLYNTGQTVNGTAGSDDADIDLPEARIISSWAINNVIVAVIDNGVAYNHPDLLSRMRSGSDCVDENGDPLGGCLYGYDFAQDDEDPLPLHYHGTHVAGTIAAEANNGTGITGIAPNAQIMALRMAFTTLSAAQATYFALQNGAKIINASYGGSTFSQTEYDAIEAFGVAGGLFVAAAGNDAADTDSSPTYPASYDLANIISVAATTQTDGLASFSNYWLTTVDIGAPGTNILSAYLGSDTTYSETFQSVTPPVLPTGYTVSWTSEQRVSKTIESSVRLATTSGGTYTGNVVATVQFSWFGLSGYDNARIEFDTLCDTEYQLGVLQDYVTLSIATGNEDFSRLLRWDVGQYDADNYFDFALIASSYYHFEIDVPQSYVRDDLWVQFKRQTDSDNNSYSGCRIDNIDVIAFLDGSVNDYAYLNGTSMAAPHVAGAAAILRGTRSDLTVAQIKSALINYGDTISALSGKTVSGKRLNLSGALESVYDIIPDAFSFVDQTGVTISTLTTGSTIISWLTYQTPITVTGGLFTTNTWSTFATTGVVNNGDTVILYLTSSASFLDTTSIQVSIGALTWSFSVTTEAESTTPDAFNFTSETVSDLATWIESESILIDGINTGTTISVTWAFYRLNTWAYIDTTGSILPTDTVTLAMTSAATFGVSQTGYLVVGGVTWTFVVTTVSEDTTPSSFSFSSVSNAQLSYVYTSSTITVTGINTGTQVTIDGWLYNINGGSYTGATWQVMSWDMLSIQLTSSSSYSIMVSSTVTIGWVTWSYSITTLADPGSNGGGWWGGWWGWWGGGAPLASSQASTWDQETTTWSATSGDNLEEELAQLSSWTSTEREIFDVSAPVVVSNTYDQETQNAYAYAFTNGITTLPSIDAAFPFGKLYRRDVAKMIVEFSISQGKNTIIHSGCSFTDIQEVEVQLQAYMIHACRLGLMGLHGDGSPWEVFRPDDVLTRAEFGTLLSRMLRWVTYNSADPNAENRYEGHLQALKDSGIMQHIETPWAVELRVYAWIIFMRLSQKE